MHAFDFKTRLTHAIPRSALRALAILMLFGCTLPVMANTHIPAEAFGRLPDVSQLTLSPNGEKVASLVRVETNKVKGVVVNIANLKTNDRKIVLSTDNSKFVIGWMAWQGNDTLLLSTFYPARFYQTPVTATRLLRIDVNSAEVKSAIPTRLFRRLDYVPFIQDNVIDFLPDNPDEILVSLRTSNDVSSEVYRINHTKGKAKRVHHQRANTLNWTTDRQNELRIARYFDDTTIRYDIKEQQQKSPWKTLFEYEVFSQNKKRPLGFGHDPNTLYYLGLHEGFDAVFKLDLSAPNSAPTLVYSRDGNDVHGSLIYSFKNKRVVGLRYALDGGYIFWGEEHKTIQDSINAALPETRNKIIGFSRDERRLLILATSDTDAGSYFYWDRDKRTMTNIAYSYKALPPEQMSDKEHISYEARDGLRISGYLTRPASAEQAGPAIIFPHGGPISYDGKGFDYWTQFFASKGYSVLQMNFRGSYGYGHDFMKSGLKDWGGKMQTDVEDGTRWLIEEGIADPDKICIVGASYGGYAALMEAANDHGLYQCAVSFAGVTDLPHLVDNSRKYINHKVVREQIGSKRKKLKQTSPVNRAKDINIPILLAHGTKDLRVPITQGRRMHKRLNRAGKEVRYLEFDDGNHFLSNEEHRVEFFKNMDNFLSKHLD